MSDPELTQAEADELIALPKVRLGEEEYEFPAAGGAVVVPLQSKDRREHFLLDISRGRIDLQKVTFQNRGRQVVVLVRLDLGGAPHRNPDGQEVQCPHLHRYREGYGDKWAVPAPPSAFPDVQDAWRSLSDFQRYCSIVEPPNIRRGLFT